MHRHDVGGTAGYDKTKLRQRRSRDAGIGALRRDDRATIERCPFEARRALAADRVPLLLLSESDTIAIDVKASFERPAARPDGASTNGAAPRRSRPVAGGGPTPPGLGETLTRLLLLASSNTSGAAERHADLVISPRNEGVGPLEFHQLDRAREAGRQAAHAALAQAPPSRFSCIPFASTRTCPVSCM